MGVLGVPVEGATPRPLADRRRAASLPQAGIKFPDGGVWYKYELPVEKGKPFDGSAVHKVVTAPVKLLKGVVRGLTMGKLFGRK